MTAFAYSKGSNSVRAQKRDPYNRGHGGIGRGRNPRAFIEAGYTVATIYTLREKWENLGGLKDMVLGLEADLLDARAVAEAARRAT